MTGFFESFPISKVTPSSSKISYPPNTAIFGESWFPLSEEGEGVQAMLGNSRLCIFCIL